MDPFYIPDSTIRWTNVYITNRGEEEPVMRYFEGFCGTDDISLLPTVGVANGSNVIDADTGDWYFFSESDSTWNLYINIKNVQG